MTHVDRRVVREPDGPQAYCFPLLAAVMRDIQRAVIAVQYVLAVRRIDPDRVIVDVAHVVEAIPRLAAINRLRRSDAAGVDDVRVIRIDANLTEVHRPLVLVRHERPRRALVRRTPHARDLRIGRKCGDTTTASARCVGDHGGGRGLLICCDFDLRVHHVRLRAADVDCDAPQCAVRQSPRRHLLPRLATVGAGVDAAALPAADESPGRALPLIHRGPQVIRIAGIDDDFRRRRVLVDIQRLRPRLAAVGRHEDTTLGVWAVQMTADGHPDGVRIRRMHDQTAKRLRIFEADIRERLAGVGALVEPIAVRRRLAVVRLAGRDVYDVGIGGRERDIGDGPGAVAVEDGLERGAIVDGLDDAADGKADVVRRRMFFIDRNVIDSATLSDGPDRTPSKIAQQRIVRLVQDAGRCRGRRLRERERRYGTRSSGERARESSSGVHGAASTSEAPSERTGARCQWK